MPQIPFSDANVVVFLDMNLLDCYEHSELINIYPHNLSYFEKNIRNYKSKDRRREILFSRFFLGVLANYWGAEIEYFDRVLWQFNAFSPMGKLDVKKKVVASISHSLNWLAIGISSSASSLGVDIHSLERENVKLEHVVKRLFPSLDLSQSKEGNYILAWTLYESLKKNGINNALPIIEKAMELFDWHRFLRENAFSLGVDLLKLYFWKTRYPPVIGSMVVKTTCMQDEKLKILLVEKISPREDSFTRALDMKVILEV